MSETVFNIEITGYVAVLSRYLEYEMILKLILKLRILYLGIPN